MSDQPRVRTSALVVAIELAVLVLIGSLDALIGPKLDAQAHPPRQEAQVDGAIASSNGVGVLP